MLSYFFRLVQDQSITMEDNQRHWEAKEAARKEALDKRIEEMGGLEAYRQHVLAKIGLA